MELELEKLNLPSDNERPFVIAGPCSAESEEQVMRTARELAMKGCHNFRAGVWKPRTKPGGFEGHGEPALPWLAEVKKETKMLVSTEVATPEHVELCLKYGIDILWIGARTTANPFAVQALADSLKGDWGLFIAVSPATRRRSIVMPRCGRSPSSSIAAYPTCLSSATPHTSVGVVNSSRRSVSRQWTSASTV